MRTKDFGSLLQLLELSQQSGLLLVRCLEEDWQARLQLQEGKPQSCHIVRRSDMTVLLNGQSAVAWLSQRGELEWSLLEDFSSPEDQVPAPPTTSVRKTGQQVLSDAATSPSAFSKGVPQRLLHSVDPSCSREARRVFALIDGKRTIETIALLLGKRAEEIQPLLHQLVSQGCIHISETER